MPRQRPEIDRPFGLPADSVEFTLDLPMPPSINRLRKITGVGRGLLAGWHRGADAQLLASRAGAFVGRIKGPCEATIELDENATGIDLDNCLKAVLDYAVSREFIPDDSPKFIRRVVLVWGMGGGGCRLTLRSLHS